MTGSSPDSKFSVVIPTHAGRRSVRATVESLLRQGGNDLEVIVVADGEGSATREVLRGLDDARLRVFEKAPEGANAARNYGLAAARHEWVAFVDDDDVPRSDWLQTFKQTVDESCVAAMGGLALWRNGNVEAVKYCRLDLDDPTMGASTLMAGAFVVRGELMRAVGGYDRAVKFGENQDLGLRILEHVLRQDLGGHIASTERVVVDVFVEDSRIRARRHGDHQAEAVTLFMSRFPERVVADPGAREAYSRILATSARRQGYFASSVHHASQAVRLNPRNPENLRSLALTPVAMFVRCFSRRP